MNQIKNFFMKALCALFFLQMCQNKIGLDPYEQTHVISENDQCEVNTRTKINQLNSNLQKKQTTEKNTLQNLTEKRIKDKKTELSDKNGKMDAINLKNFQDFMTDLEARQKLSKEKEIMHKNSLPKPNDDQCICFINQHSIVVKKDQFCQVCFKEASNIKPFRDWFLISSEKKPENFSKRENCPERVQDAGPGHWKELKENFNPDFQKIVSQNLI